MNWPLLISHIIVYIYPDYPRAIEYAKAVETAINTAFEVAAVVLELDETESLRVTEAPPVE
jgi:hypothetical protein